MKKNNIISEIHNIRKNYAKRFNNDLHLICQDAMHKQGFRKRQVIPANPKPVRNKISE